MSVEPEILASNQAFYTAFREQDLDTMEALWAAEAPVACIHPGWPALRGRDAVLESWREIFEQSEDVEIQCVDPVVHVLGNVAFVTCTEVLPGGHLAATNVFVHEHDMWRLVHHQAGPSQPVTVQGAPPDDTWN